MFYLYRYPSQVIYEYSRFFIYEVLFEDKLEQERHGQSAKNMCTRSYCLNVKDVCTYN